MKKLLLSTVAALLAATTPSNAGQLPDLVQYVNTLQGTDSHWGFSFGNTYPATAMPYPQHTWSPQTGRNGDGWKYTYNADKIRGFQQVHQCSPWMGDYGTISLMPGIGKVEGNQHLRGLKFSHENETAKPHYYSVRFDNGILAEVAPTERTAHIRFSFPDNGQQAFVILDGMMKESEFVVDKENNRITGWNNTGGHFNKPGFRNRFIIQFDQPILEFGMFSAIGDKPSVLEEGVGESGVRARVGKNKDNPEEIFYGAYVTFKPGAKVQAKVSSSYISLEQAQITLDREIGGDTTLEETKRRGFETWNELLNRVLVEGGTLEQTRTFYSCLFRSNLFSHKFYELDGNGEPHYWSPYDGRVHYGYMFTDNGFWDTFRSQFPLTNILHPTMQGRYMNALLDASDQFGWLPAWSAPGETGGMIGNHVISLLADAWAKGIRTFDPARALEKYRHDVTAKGPGGAACGRAGYKDYWTLGYVPYTGNNHGATAWTLEYSYDDWCAYNLAKMTGNTEMEEFFSKALYNYKNLFNPESGFFGAKDEGGKLVAPFDPFEWGGPYTEGNQWHYLWSVQHDPQGLIDLFGSDAKFVAKLDAMFTAPGTVVPGTYGRMIHEMEEMVWADMGQYAHGNQPVQHATFLYNYAGQPWKTQYWNREVQTRLYNSTEKGYPGDEDQGGLSSWYVLSALGFYAVTPGTDQYVIGSPLFPKATITLEDGKRFVVEAKNASVDNRYIASGKLNGKVLKKNFITYSDIVDGGKLSFEMSDKPNTKRNTRKSSAPYSYSIHK